MSKEKINPQSPEEIAKAAQEAAIKAAMEQAQSMFGGIPGFQMPDMNSLQEQINAQMKAAVPNLNDIQAQQAETGTLGGIDSETVTNAAEQNMAYASQMMKDMLNDTYANIQSESSLTQEDLSEVWGELLDLSDTAWEIRRNNDAELTDEQNHILAFGAPLLVYNSENVNAIESQIDADAFKEQLKSWWNVTDKDSTLEIADWLLNEGHHADADESLSFVLEKGIECISDSDMDDDSKMEDVCLIVEHMLEKGYCSSEKLPSTALAWDLVRIVNLARWSYLCGYLNETDMWNLMSMAMHKAKDTFNSWEEYGLSFVFGRGVWHGDTDDCDTSYEIVSVLHEKEDSPWNLMEW